jgi:hypothetical protein
MVCARRVVFVGVVLLQFVQQLQAQPWWSTRWHYRVPVSVSANGYERSDKPAELVVNFSQLFTAIGPVRTLDTNSLRIIEVSSVGTILDTLVQFQFDRDSVFNAATHARGTLTFILGGTTASNATRFFHLYFDAIGSQFPRPSFPTQVLVSDTSNYQGQNAFMIRLRRATYIYHKLGGGFASAIDSSQRDWISYRPGGGSAGEYRGIPNLGVCAHPGYANSTSTLVSRGPIKATIQSRTNDNQWSWKWDFFPSYARMTLQAAATTYWFLYEGTPGGQFDFTDFWVRSTGERRTLAQDEGGRFQWVYFGDRSLRRVLYLAHHEADTLPDGFRSMESNMTVFGFGRQPTSSNTTRWMTAVPQRLTMGFAEDSLTASTTISDAFRDLNVTLGAATTTDVDDKTEILTPAFSLEQNYPNPFNPTTEIRFQMSHPSSVSLRVYDALGREVRTLVNEELKAGSHKIFFDAGELAGGVYYYRLTAGDFVSTRKLVMIR